MERTALINNNKSGIKRSTVKCHISLRVSFFFCDNIEIYLFSCHRGSARFFFFKLKFLFLGTHAGVKKMNVPILLCVIA